MPRLYSLDLSVWRDAIRKLLSQKSMLFCAGTLGVAGLAWRIKRRPLTRLAERTLRKKNPRAGKPPPAPKVDLAFFRRFIKLLRLLVPSWRSREAFLLLLDFLCLIARSLCSIRVAAAYGEHMQAIVSGDRRAWVVCMLETTLGFAIIACVNASLKFLTNLLAGCFRRRLTKHVHELYMKDRAYYRVGLANEGQRPRMANAGQRITDDIKQFADLTAALYSRTFKPLLDVILTSHRLVKFGVPGSITVYLYFVCIGQVIRVMAPPFGRMTAQMQALEGDFQESHSRLTTYAEEVAFLEGGATEREILNERLDSVTCYSERFYAEKFGQGCVHNYMRFLGGKLGNFVLGYPLLMEYKRQQLGAGAAGAGVQASVASGYREGEMLLVQAGDSLGDLIEIYKKLQTMSGYTSRVSELLEAIEKPTGRATAGMTASEGLKFDDVEIRNPDGRLLARGLNVDLEPGTNWMITGPNGAGKSSLFRTAMGLWEPAAGSVSRPPPGPQSTMCIPQRCYLVSGTLLDQVTYPHRLGPAPGAEVEERVRACLADAGLGGKLAEFGGRLDTRYHDWADVLSGGEKQRVMFARLYFHRPTFALLDEATSGINPGDEAMLYQGLKKRRITVVSIAHRMELKQFHEKNLHFQMDSGGGVLQRSVSGL